MTELTATTAQGTIAWVCANARAAETAAARLRGAGFADVRLSEGGGTTSEQHVAESEGLTSSDFAAHLERAGFGRADASALTDAIAKGGVLVTLAAGAHVADALAVMRGETIAQRFVTPVDMRSAPLTETPRVNAERVDAAPQAERIAPNTSAPAADASAHVSNVIPLREERLDVTTERERGEARIRKEVVTEQRTITVPVQREQLVVERDGEATVRIPLSDDPGKA